MPIMQNVYILVLPVTLLIAGTYYEAYIFMDLPWTTYMYAIHEFSIFFLVEHQYVFFMYTTVAVEHMCNVADMFVQWHMPVM